MQEVAEVSAKYRLRRFKRSTDRDYKSALGIYLSNISPGSRTNSNEITYWLDNYGKSFEDQFYVCGFYSESELVGYTQFVYFRRQRLIFFDYLVLHENYRTHGECFQFARMLRNWIDENRVEIDYVTAEVAFETSSGMPSHNSIKLVELFQMIGFSVAHCEYFQPLLGLDNPQSNMRAHFLVWGRGNPTSIRPDTLLEIIRTIFFDHYERWYTPFLKEELPKYRKLLTDRFGRFSESIEGQTDVVLNGINLPTKSLMPMRPPRSKARPLRVSLAVLSAVWLLCLGFLLLQDWFQLSLKALLATVGTSLVVFVSAFALVHRRGERILDLLLNFFKAIVGKGK